MACVVLGNFKNGVAICGCDGEVIEAWCAVPVFDAEVRTVPVENFHDSICISGDHTVLGLHATGLGRAH